MRVENVKGAVWTVDETEFYRRRPQRSMTGYVSQFSFCEKPMQDSKTSFGIHFKPPLAFILVRHFFFCLFSLTFFKLFILVITYSLCNFFRSFEYTRCIHQSYTMVACCGITSNGITSNATGNRESKMLPKVVKIRSLFFHIILFLPTFFSFFLYFLIAFFIVRTE